MPHHGISLTHSQNSLVTDSAAASTAWATGFKTKNRYVSVDENKKELETIIEKLHLKGFASGLVATSSITHATPAAFYSHVDSRYKEDEIANQLEIDNLVYQSVANLRKSIIGDSLIEDLEMSCFTGSYVTGTVNQEYLNWVENEYKS